MCKRSHWFVFWSKYSELLTIFQLNSFHAAVQMLINRITNSWRTRPPFQTAVVLLLWFTLVNSLLQVFAKWCSLSFSPSRMRTDSDAYNQHHRQLMPPWTTWRFWMRYNSVNVGRLMVLKWCTTSCKSLDSLMGLIFLLCHYQTNTFWFLWFLYM